MEQKNTDSGLRKLNSFMLSLCTAGIIWMASTVNGLEIKMSRIETLLDGHTTSITDVKMESDKNSLSIYDLINRLTKLEIINDEKNKRHG